MTRLDWSLVLGEARRIVNGYDTPVTLRQLHYRLVAAGLIPNTQTAYKGLSARTAAARRAGEFPDLTDNTRQIHLPASWDGPGEALADLAEQYRRDRTEGQPVTVALAVEKRGLVAQLTTWFGDYGVPVIELGGYCGQAHVDRVRGHVRGQDRTSVLLFAGDFDPSGEDLYRDFLTRSACWDDSVRVALTAAQVEDYGLPPQPGKATDSRAAAFLARHGRLVQVEVDALPPTTLRELFTDALNRYWDMSAYEDAVAREREEREELERLAEDAA